MSHILEKSVAAYVFLTLLLSPGAAIRGGWQSSANYTVQANVLAGAGKLGTSANYYNNSTLAQTTSISWQSSANYGNRQGYWGNSQYNPTMVKMKEFSARGYDGLVAVEWQTGAEIDNLGFHLYRAESRDGEYSRITERLILVLGANPAGGRYLFIDRTVENGRTYYYKLEDIDFTGGSEMHGPVRANPTSNLPIFSYNPDDYAIVTENEDTTLANPSPTPGAEPLPTAHSSLPTPSPLPTATPFPIPYSPIPIIDFGDFNGDGSSDITCFHPGSGLWAVRGITRCYFGGGEDIPVTGDYDGDGRAEIAVFREVTGIWAVRETTRCYFGGPGDIPVPADYDGDGRTGFALFRGESGLWAIRDLTRCHFGTEDDLPIPGDYDGDGTAGIALFRGKEGLWAVRDLNRAYFGEEGDIPVPADYDGDGSDDIAIFRETPGIWAIRDLSRIYFGSTDDIPIPADFNGDGMIEIGVFRERIGLWAIRGWSRCYYGDSDSQPVVK